MYLKILNLADVFVNLNQLKSVGIEGARLGVEASLADAEREAKKNAPWTDRTSNARNSILGSKAVVNGNEISGTLSIGVDYGKYLELKNGGKYRIIWPTLEVSATKVGKWVKAMTRL